MESGPQDVAQYLVSHINPSERRFCERDLLKGYHDTLVSNGVEGYSYKQCEADYVAGGTQRWIWLLALLSGMCPDEWVQYFQDQLVAFMKDWGVNSVSVGMPKV